LEMLRETGFCSGIENYSMHMAGRRPGERPHCLLDFFPENAVEYFVSYYDYYQPEAYVPQTDTFIEKDSAINEDIERMRISASSALLSRRDVIVIASVSCIYGLGSPEDFLALMIPLRQGLVIKRDELLTRLVANQYSRNDAILERCTFRARGETIDIWPAYMESAIRLEFWGDTLEQIRELDAVTVRPGKTLDKFDLYPANQYVTSAARVKTAAEAIRAELEERVARDAARNGLLLGHRKLLDAHGRTAARRAPPLPPGLLPRGPTGLHRRKPCLGLADRRDVPRRPRPQGKARRLRLPPALRHGESPAAARGVRYDFRPDGLRLGHTGAA
ncbi:MAG: hypothetical protein LW857_07460, partial [Verrucomicrobiae bacterium]|nr:hypothetical protein [Verrucomicrobiae bacterium]